MGQEDSVHLLKECDAGLKMAISSFDEVMGKVQSADLSKVLEMSKEEHTKLQITCHNRLIQFEEEDKQPNPVAKAMSTMKINFKLLPEPKDYEIAELMFDGCNMGVKSLYGYMRQYPVADEDIKDLTQETIRCEEDLREALKKYL